MTITGTLLLRRRWSLPVVVAAYAVATRSVARGLPASVDRRTRVRIAARLGGRGSLALHAEAAAAAKALGLGFGG